jgi:AcrR family transcriptional regulator
MVKSATVTGRPPVIRGKPGSPGDSRPPGAPRSPGRPRRPGADEAILRATLDLIAESGASSATVAAVAERTGVARASIYLRWPSRDALVDAAIRTAIGREPFELSGDLEVDFRRGAEQAQAILAEPRFRAVLPALVASLLDRSGGSVTYDSMFPNRLRLAEEYRVLARTSGFRDDMDPLAAADMLIGALLNRLLGSGEPPSKAIAHEIAEMVLTALRTAPASPRRTPSPQR